MAQEGRIGVKAILLLGLGAIIVIFAFIIFTSRQDANSDAAGTGNTFANALIENDAVAAYGTLTSDLQASLTEEYWQQWVNTIFGKQGNKSFELASQSIIENPGEEYTATEQPTRLVYEFELADTSYAIPITVVLSNNEWKIDKISGNEP